MNRMAAIAVCGLLLTGGARAGVIVDRVVATVNRQAILESDVREEVSFQRLMEGSAPGKGSEDEQRATLNRLIDRELLREQIHEGEVKPPTAQEIENHVAELKARLDAGKSWSELLSRYGITEEELHRRIALQLEQLRLVDLRLRPAVQIEPAEVQRYYQEQFLPKVLQSGAQPLDQTEAAPKVREILTQQKMNQLLSSWLETLRSQAEIKVLPADSVVTSAMP